MRIYYICECCDAIVKCVDCSLTLPYEHEVIPNDAVTGTDILDDNVRCVKSLCHSCSEELKIESVYGCIKEIRYH